MRTCPACGTTAPPSFLACPSCKRLFFATDLAALHAEASALEAGGELSEAAAKLREMLPLLPEGAGQAAKVRARIAELETRVPASTTKTSRAPAWLTGLGAGGLVLWKLGAPLLALLSKAKFLVAGLLQAKTLLSMLFTASIYDRAGFGGPLVLFLASIYVHEMGHVWAFRRYGIAVSAPMFVPGFGAFVRGAHYPEAKRAAADVALSGPIWGVASGIVCVVAAAMARDHELAFGALLIAEVNLFNLVPVWHLDGSRAIETLAKKQRLALGLVGLLACGLAGSPMGLVASVGHLVRAFVGNPPSEGEPSAVRTFVALVIALATLRGAAAFLATG